MITISIVNYQSDENLPALKKVIRDDWTLEGVNISYNPSKGLPDKEYPVEILFHAGDELIQILIYSLTVGYYGSGPSATASILDFLSIKYDEEDIYSKRKADDDGNILLNY